MDIMRILLAIILPPLGVFLTKGISPAFVINILLTILGWLPGSIHAVWIVVKQAESKPNY
ncbi:MAG: YqaE/Pmp3 family membrane protein [Spirulinaceae cyanobacterium]